MIFSTLHLALAVPSWTENAWRCSEQRIHTDQCCHSVVTETY